MVNVYRDPAKTAADSPYAEPTPALTPEGAAARRYPAGSAEARAQKEGESQLNYDVVAYGTSIEERARAVEASRRATVVGTPEWYTQQIAARDAQARGTTIENPGQANLSRPTQSQAIVTAIANRPRSVDVANFGDRKTQQLLSAVPEGDRAAALGVILEQQRQEATKTPTLTDDRFFQNQLNLWNAQAIEGSAGEHAYKKSSPNPADWTANVRENLGDIALVVEKAGNPKDNFGKNYAFNPNVGSVMSVLPQRTNADGTVTPVGLQEYAWMGAVSGKSPGNVSWMPAINYINSQRGRQGIYGNLAGGVPDEFTPLPAGYSNGGMIHQPTIAAPDRLIGSGKVGGLGVVSDRGTTGLPKGVYVTGILPQSPPSRGAVSLPPLGGYVYRNDPMAIILEETQRLGDALTFGLFTPGKAQIEKYGQNKNPITDTFTRSLTAVELQKPQMDQLSAQITTEQSTIDAMTAGKLNAEGEFTGSSQEYAQYLEAMGKLNRDTTTYNQYGEKIKGVMTSGYETGAIIPIGNKGEYILNPDNNREYGAASEFSQNLGQTIQGFFTDKPLKPSDFYKVEQSPAFAALPPAAQYGEGVYKVLATDPLGLANSALQGVEIYATLGVASIGLTALAPAAGVTPIGISQTIGTIGLKTMASPVIKYGTAAVFVAHGAGTATEWGSLPAPQARSNLGGLTIHLAAMTGGAMAPEGLATVNANYNPVSFNRGVPLRSGTEGTFNYVSTISTRNPFTPGVPATVRAYSISGVDVAGTKYGWGPPTNAMKGLTITADPMFNVRSPSYAMTEPQRVLLDPFFRDVARGTPAEPLVNAMFDMKANIGTNIRGGSETTLKYTNAQPSGTLTQTGIDPSVQTAVHEVLADAGAIRLGSAAQTDWLGSRFMRDTAGSDIDIDIPKANYDVAIEQLKSAYSKNVEPVRLPETGGRFSLSKNPESETIISPGTIEKFPDVRSLETTTASGKIIGQQTPEYGIESKASRSLGGRVLEYNPEKGVEVNIHAKKFNKDISDIYAASRGISRTAYDQNQFGSGQIYESMSDNLKLYAESTGMADVIKTIPEDILKTPEAIQAKAISGIKSGVYKPQVFGVDLPNTGRGASEYPEAYYKADIPSYKFPLSIITPSYPTAQQAKPAPADYPITNLEPFPPAYPEATPDYPKTTVDYVKGETTTGYPKITVGYPPVKPPVYPPSYPPVTPTKYPPSTPPNYPPNLPPVAPPPRRPPFPPTFPSLEGTGKPTIRRLRFRKYTETMVPMRFTLPKMPKIVLPGKPQLKVVKKKRRSRK